MIAYDYPLLGMFWTMMIFFFWIAWIMIVFRTVFDIFRSKDLGGIGKAAWLLFVIIVPWLGVLVYLIARGNGMVTRDLEAQQAQQDAAAAYIRQAVGTGGGTADELVKICVIAA